ncbi:MAG: hypothetical protein OQJ93_11405, partial [Ignavibacteriaceae bacterium]|nr:hypothetical protein [Ignavibacteriaceae bacterium]
MRCDGAAIPGGETLSGNTPDLSDDRFIRGITGVTGGTGAATDLTHTHTFAHTHDTNSSLSTIDFSHDHSGSSGTATAVFTAGTLATSGGAASFDKTVMNTNQNSHGHNYGVQNYIASANLAYITGSEVIGIRNYDSSGFLGWNYSSSVSTASRTTNTNTAGTTKSITATLKESTATTQFATATWNSTTVNTTFTQPTLDKAALNTDQTAHSHSVSSDLTTQDFSHTHTTNSQSTSTTGSGLSAVSVQPKYFDAIYL